MMRISLQEELLASWNAQGGRFRDALNDARKYVASSNPAAGLDWPNSTLLRSDIPAAVAHLTQELGHESRDHADSSTTSTGVLIATYELARG